MAQGARARTAGLISRPIPAQFHVKRLSPLCAIVRFRPRSGAWRHRRAGALAGYLGFSGTRRRFSLYSARSSTRFPGVGHGRDDDDIFIAVQHRQGGRLHPRPQHADRHRLVHAAGHLGLCHLAWHARFHHRRIAPPPAGQNAGGMSISNDVLVIAVVVALTFLMWLALRETFGAKRDFRDAAHHLPALRVPGDLVDRLRLRLLVEPDLRRGGDAHRPVWLAGGCAGCQRRRRRAARCGARPARQRGELVGQPDGARGDQRRQLRHASGAGRGPALQCAAQRARFRHHAARRHDALVARAGAGGCRAAAPGAAGLGGATVEERQRNFEARASEIRGRARNIAARSNQLGKSTAAEMRALASAVAVAPGAAGFSCYDPTLAERLRAGGRPGRAAGRIEAARGRLQRRSGRRRQRGQESLAEHGRVQLQPVTYVFSRRRDRRGRPHRHGRADHRPRPDRAVGHHRHRSRAAGAGDRQSAARAAVDPALRRADPADQRRHRHGDCSRQRRRAIGCKAISSITSGRRIWSYPISMRPIRRTRRSKREPRHEPARRGAERLGPRALAGAGEADGCSEERAGRAERGGDACQHHRSV